MFPVIFVILYIHYTTQYYQFFTSTFRIMDLSQVIIIYCLLYSALSALSLSYFLLFSYFTNVYILSPSDSHFTSVGLPLHFTFVYVDPRQLDIKATEQPKQKNKKGQIQKKQKRQAEIEKKSRSPTGKTINFYTVIYI